MIAYKQLAAAVLQYKRYHAGILYIELTIGTLLQKMLKPQVQTHFSHNLRTIPLLSIIHIAIAVYPLAITVQHVYSLRHLNPGTFVQTEHLVSFIA